jgi:hypothetical protein
MFQVRNDWLLDTILTIVLLAFILELILMALTDGSYFGSYICLMDSISTLSIVADISYLLGQSATEGHSIDSGRGASEAAVLRLTRIPRLATRAGRLIRTSRALWMFLGEFEKRNQSNMLLVLTTQVRSAIVLRLFSILFLVGSAVLTTMIFVYPAAEESIIVWPNLLNSDSELFYANQMPAARLSKRLAQMAKFFENLDYRPGTVCFRRSARSPFNCNPEALGIRWNPGFTQTERGGSLWVVSNDNFRTTFDMSEPQRLEALGNTLLLIVMMGCLIGFAVDLNARVTQMALNPLGRVLESVQYHCSTIFKYTEDINQDLDDQMKRKENYDCMDLTNESELVEAVVDKLVIITNRAVEQLEPACKVAKTEEDKMMLCFQERPDLEVMKESSAKRTLKKILTASTLQSAEQFARGTAVLDAIEMLDTASFNALEVPSDSACQVALCIFEYNRGASEFIKENVGMARLNAFLGAVRIGHKDNPFHNFAHALDVLATVSRHMHQCKAERFLTETQIFSELVSAVSHIMGHLGVDNWYLKEKLHELALTYNDVSPMQNMSLAEMFRLCAIDKQNIFQKIDGAMRKSMRKDIIENVLHSDLSKHSALMSNVGLFYQLNSSELCKGETCLTPAMLELFSKEAPLFQRLFLHIADRGIPTKPWDVCYRYSQLAMDECFAQGELEKAAGMPVQLLNDAEKVSRSYIQVAWISHVVLPVVEVVIKVFPPLDVLVHSLGENFENWMLAFQEESGATEDEAVQYAQRIRAVADRCQDMRTDADWDIEDDECAIALAPSGAAQE